MKNPLLTIPTDKCGHTIAGALIFTIMFAISGMIFASFVVVAIAAAGKEIYDKFHPLSHTADVWDFVATLSLAAVIALSYYIGG